MPRVHPVGGGGEETKAEVAAAAPSWYDQFSRRREAADAVALVSHDGAGSASETAALVVQQK